MLLLGIVTTIMIGIFLIVLGMLFGRGFSFILHLTKSIRILEEKNSLTTITLGLSSASLLVNISFATSFRSTLSFLLINSNSLSFLTSSKTLSTWSPFLSESDFLSWRFTRCLHSTSPQNTIMETAKSY